MGLGWGLCICVRVYLCMGWGGVGGLEEFATDKFTVSESVREVLYNHYNVFGEHDI